MKPDRLIIWMLLLPLPCLGAPRPHLATEGLPPFLRDRGEGVPLSQFATYVQPGQLLVYPFFEGYHNRGYEYEPIELGYDGEEAFLGEFEATEELLFLAWGVSSRLAIELEAAIIQAELERDPDDASTPPEVSDSGVGDVEGQLRWRWAAERPRAPEIFSYFEFVAPTQEEGSLIGTTDWELKLGTGVTRGFSLATMTLRGAVEYDFADEAFDIGEVALEAVRRLSPNWRIYLGVEGAQDEVEGITEVQWHFAAHHFLKVNNGFGLSSKANDWAPEVGVVFGF